jgi:hypothetical protein
MELILLKIGTALQLVAILQCRLLHKKNISNDSVDYVMSKMERYEAHKKHYF